MSRVGGILVLSTILGLCACDAHAMIAPSQPSTERKRKLEHPESTSVKQVKPNNIISAIKSEDVQDTMHSMKHQNSTPGPGFLWLAWNYNASEAYLTSILQRKNELPEDIRNAEFNVTKMSMFLENCIKLSPIPYYRNTRSPYSSNFLRAYPRIHNIRPIMMVAAI